MKKKILFILAFVWSCLWVQAGNGIVVLQHIDDNGNPIGGHRDVIPVDYDADQIRIRPDTIMYQAEVIVKDQKGQVMNRQRMDLVPGLDNALSVPDTFESEKQQVEIIFDKKKYNGFLE